MTKKIQKGDSDYQVKITINLMELKMLHNLCSETHPDMVGYHNIQKQFKEVIEKEEKFKKFGL